MAPSKLRVLYQEVGIRIGDKDPALPYFSTSYLVSLSNDATGIQWSTTFLPSLNGDAGVSLRARFRMRSIRKFLTRSILSDVPKKARLSSSVFSAYLPVEFRP